MKNENMCKTCMNKCKAECCAWVPFNYNFLKKYESKMVRPVLCLAEHPNGRQVIPITHIEKRVVNGVETGYIEKSDQKCPFLTDKNKCNIYEERPQICRFFGTSLEPDNNFTCHYHIGRNYSYPKDGTPEERMIDNAMQQNKYPIPPQIIKEIFEGTGVPKGGKTLEVQEVKKSE